MSNGSSSLHEGLVPSIAEEEEGGRGGGLLNAPTEGQPDLSTHREPDELDALLHRTETPQRFLNDLNYNAIGSSYSKSHRKSMTIGGAITTTSTADPIATIDNYHNTTETMSRSAYTSHLHRSSGRRRTPLHRKNKSSISELLALASGSLEPLREDFREVGMNLRTQFVLGLDEMDRGETGNFDMSLTRSLSVLPDNVPDLAHEAGMETQSRDGRGPCIQYLTLFGAVVGISSNSTALHMLNGVAAPMKLFWRMSASYLVLSPLAIHYLMRDGIPKLSIGGWLTFLMATLCFATQNCLFYTALQYTTIGNAVIYSNSQALLLILGKGFAGEPIHFLEGLGVIVAFSGAILCSTDSESRSEKTDTPTTAILGDCLALLAACLGVFYLTCAKAVRSSMSVTLFIFCVMFFGSFMVLLFIALTDGDHMEWNLDPLIGVFGGFSTYNGRIFVLLYLAVICNGLGTMGIVRAMEYFDNVVIAVATLMEPLLASFIAFAFHAGLLPGPLGWFGNILVVAGTLAVVYPSMNKKDASIH